MDGIPEGRMLGGFNLLQHGEGSGKNLLVCLTSKYIELLFMGKHFIVPTFFKTHRYQPLPLLSPLRLP